MLIKAKGNSISHPLSSDHLVQIFRPFVENPELLDGDDRWLLCFCSESKRKQCQNNCGARMTAELSHRTSA
jgi:hypothetical protein